MLDIMEFAIHFKWYSMKTKSFYRVFRIKYEAGRAVTMTNDDGEVLFLEYAEPHWCEFVTLIHLSDFQVPRSHGLNGIINFNKRKTKLRIAFEELQIIPYAPVINRSSYTHDNN